MQQHCYIDKNIELSGDDEAFLNAMHFVAVPFAEDEVDYSRIEYLLLHSKLSDEQLSQMKNCKYIGIRAHNTDYVNSKITEQNNILVSGLMHQHGINAVAEHTFSLILSLAKNLVLSHQNVIQGKWRENLPLNYELNSKKLGIVGNGRIGHRVAELGKAFGMEILIAAKKGDWQSDKLPLQTVLKNADIVSLHLSSQAENNNYIDRECLMLMKDNSILINTARGSVLDYQALLEEIEKGKFIGVGLDVFDSEPLQNSLLAQYPNVILTPHIAYMTGATLADMNNELLVNLKQYLEC